MKQLENLTAAERRIYSDLCRQIDALKTEYVFPGLKHTDVAWMLELALLNRPDFFWLTGAAHLTTKTRGSDSTAYIQPEFRKNASVRQVSAKRRKLEKRVTALIGQAKRSESSLYGQILFLHDAVAQNTRYKKNNGHSVDAYGCLVEGRAVCEGYAGAFMLLMQRLGVPCGKIRGYSTAGNVSEGSHVWNYVRLDDGYYYVDVTWDDPLLKNGEKRETVSHAFFCLGPEELQKTHRIKPGQPVLGRYGTKYEYYRYMGWYIPVYSFDAVRKAAAQQLRSGKTFSVKFGSPAQTQLAKKDLVDAKKIYTVPGVSNSISYSVSKSGLILEVTIR